MPGYLLCTAKAIQCWHWPSLLLALIKNLTYKTGWNYYDYNEKSNAERMIRVDMHGKLVVGQKMTVQRSRRQMEAPLQLWSMCASTFIGLTDRCCLMGIHF